MTGFERADWIKSLSRLEIVGGEPFYIKQWHQLFDEIIAVDKAKEVVLSISTNCTLYYPKLVEKISLNFGQVGIGLSIDGIGPTYEYLRHPGKWEEVLGNMHKYHAAAMQYPKLYVSVSYTISWLNAFDLPLMHALIREQFPKFSIWNNIVHYPEHMALWAIPTEIKDNILATWNAFDWPEQYRNDIEGIKKYMYSREITEEQFKQNLEVLRKTDKLRSEDLLTSIPIFKDYFSF